MKFSEKAELPETPTWKVQLGMSLPWRIMLCELGKNGPQAGRAMGTGG